MSFLCTAISHMLEHCSCGFSSAGHTSGPGIPAKGKGRLRLPSWAKAFLPHKVFQPCQYHFDFPFWPPALFGVNCSR